MPDKTRDREITSLIAHSLAPPLSPFLCPGLSFPLLVGGRERSYRRSSSFSPLFFDDEPGERRTAGREGPNPAPREGRKRMMARTLSFPLSLSRTRERGIDLSGVATQTATAHPIKCTRCSRNSGARGTRGWVDVTARAAVRSRLGLRRKMRNVRRNTLSRGSSSNERI